MTLRTSFLLLVLLPSCSETGVTALEDHDDPRTDPGAPLLELDPELYAMSDRAPLCETSGQIVARSIGDTAVTISEINLGAPFVLDAIQLPLTIERNEEVPISFTWIPEGDSTVFLEVISDSIDGPEYSEIVGEVLALEQVTEVFEAPRIPQAEVYVAAPYDIYEWDVDTHETRHIGRSPQLLLDIAIDYDGVLLGSTSSSQLLRIDPETGDVSTFLSISVGGANALTVLPDNRIIAASGRNVYEIDRDTGEAVIMMTSDIGSSSGDIVAIGDMLYWSVSGGDRIVLIDPATWTETLVGNTSRSGLWGLASPSDDLWAFSSGGFAYRINTSTAEVLEEVHTGIGAYGATHNPFFVTGTLETSFTLREPAFEQSIEVTVDGVPSTAWSFDAASNRVIFDPDALEGAEVVEITYEVPEPCV